MISLDIIKAPINRELLEFEDYLKSAVRTDMPALTLIVKYVLRRRGKQIRPMFVFLTAAMNGRINETTHMAAASIELMHVATLVHDDVVDESYQRRGQFSINALWKNKLAVLVGDYIFAKAMLINIDGKNYNFMDIIGRSIKNIIEGEIIQMRKTLKPDIKYEVYYDIIRKKTASLIAASMATGAASVTDDKAVHEKMYDIGIDVGIAFQIKDDIFDYQPVGNLGKPAGNDLREGKVTLPLLYVLNNLPNKERRRLLHDVKAKNKSQAQLHELADYVKEHGGLAFAGEQMNMYRDKAVARLLDFPESQERNSLIALVNYVTARER